MPNEEFERAQEVLESLSHIEPVNDTILIDSSATEDLDTIIEHAETSKGILAVLITSLVKKIISPSQDIRKHQAGMDGGYSGRRLDTKVITPFLKRNNFPAMAESGWLTRSLEQASPYTLDYKGAIRPLELKDAFLRTLNRIEEGSLNSELALKYIFTKLTEQRDEYAITVAKPQGLPIDDIITCLDKHFYYEYESAGASRLPVLAIYAAYTQMVREISRYKDWVLSDLGRHNAADRRANTIGDIQVLDKTGSIVEAVEIKYEKQIDTGMIMEAFKKFETQRVERYYILTTYKNQQHNEEITKTITEIKNENGCQVIVNGVEPTLKYYLRLLKNPDTFIVAYAELLEKDPDVKYEQRKVWNNIIEEMGSH
ncbi:MAG: hypothetical protein OH338_05520 [Candidatus Parvarchaeota archaeon]|nr:hypothetical protein [Candidatus Parvarchaeum tengchongense]